MLNESVTVKEEVVRINANTKIMTKKLKKARYASFSGQ